MDLHLNELANLAWLQFLQVTALAAAAGLLARLVCRHRPHLAYMLWILVLLKCLTPPLWSCPAGIFSWTQVHFAAPQAVNQAVEQEASTAVAGSRQTVPARPDYANRFAPGNSAAAIDIPAAGIDKSGVSWQFQFSWNVFLAVIWVAGAVTMTVIVFIKWIAFCHVLRRSADLADDAIESLSIQLARRLGLRRKITLLVTPESIGPAVFGLFRPVIVLPQAVIAGKTQRQIEPIIAHELVHVRRGDAFWGFLQIAAEILWWFHPLVWWANRQTCRERERCCDEEVVASLQCKPAVYAHCLLDVLESERNWRPILAIPGFKSVEITSKRLEEIMIRAKYFNKKTPRWCWAFLAVAAVLVLPGREIVLGGGETILAQDQNQTPLALEKTGEQAKSETIITGQVLDPSGKPMPDAQVAIVGQSRRPTPSGNFSDEGLKTFGLAKSDAQGRFRLTAPRLSSAAYYAAYVLAAADGHGLGWQPVGLDVELPDISIRLPQEQVVHGRVVDAKGQPAANAKVYVTWIGKNVLGNINGVQYWEPPKQKTIWPSPVTTDQDGRFTLRGVNRDQGMKVQILDDRFAIDWMEIKPSGKDPQEEITLAPPPAQIVEGEILYEDTHKPVPYARVAVSADEAGQGRCLMGRSGQADANGHFRIVPYSGKVLEITAYPPQGEPYLTVRKTYKLTFPAKSKEEPISRIYEDAIALPEGTTAPKVEMALPRGVLVLGKIIETSSGKPVAYACIQYEDRHKNPYMREEIVTDGNALVVSKEDGSFQIAVPPGPGILFIQSPGNDYIYQTIGNWELFDTPAWGRRLYVNAYVPLDLKPDAEPADLKVSIRRGVAVKGRLVGPDDRPADEVLILSRVFITPYDTEFRTASKIVARGGQFELHGLDPEKSVPVYFLDSKNELGATMDISGKSAEAQPLVVRLSPCGKAVARFVDPDGKPLVKYKPDLQIIVTPGPSSVKIGDLIQHKKPIDKKEPVSDYDFVANFDREHYWNKPVTDEQGRCTFPSLIPGATYRLFTLDKSGSLIDKDFTVKAGETSDLGDIVFKKD